MHAEPSASPTTLGTDIAGGDRATSADDWTTAGASASLSGIRLWPSPRQLVVCVEPFVAAAFVSLSNIGQFNCERGPLSMRQGNTHTTQELTLILGVSGDLQGLAMYGLSVMTALKLGGALRGQELLQLDDALLEAMGELGNRIAAQAVELLARAEVESEVAAPRLIQGVGIEVPTVAPTLLVPVNTDAGKLSIEVSLRRVQVG